MVYLVKVYDMGIAMSSYFTPQSQIVPKVVVPHLHYVDSLTNGVTVSLTDGLDYPLEHTKAYK